ncbi:hypothetical protein TrCOL_g2153 [Triparma columacea]|uniref:Uncharacterized protein n=1 Tax=Triparma columacea TaxID=722753 RepID=A0A9W7GKT0_9STRA|nr:hypothetical protein TrCOL_g2153 [Triparma columacea]
MNGNLIGNRLCHAREVERKMKLHKEKVKKMKCTLNRREPNFAQHLKINCKKQQLQNEHFMQIEHENQLLMKKIYKIMNDPQDESGMEYLPGVRITKNQSPMVDCHINSKKQTIVPGKAVPVKSLRFESWERNYNKHVDENQAMMKRIKERKPVYSRKEWQKFADKQEKYSSNARNSDLTAGHLPTKKLTKKKLGGSFGNSSKVKKTHLSPTGVFNEISRTRTPNKSPLKQHVKKKNDCQSVMVEADTLIDGMPCTLVVSELTSSFHDEDGVLTHGISGILVEASTDEGSVKGEGMIMAGDLQKLCKRLKQGTSDTSLDSFIQLKPFKGNMSLYPVLEASVTSDQESMLSDIVMSHVYVSNYFVGGERKLKVTVGHKHVEQIS